MTSKLLCVSLLATLAVAAERSAFTGTWEGKMNGLPAVQLVVRTGGTAISGDITFLFMQRKDEQSEWKIAGKSESPLLEPQLKDGKLVFEVRHAKKHGSSEMGPNVRFRVEAIGDQELRLYRLDGSEKDSPGFVLSRCYLTSGCAAIQ